MELSRDTSKSEVQTVKMFEQITQNSGQSQVETKLRIRQYFKQSNTVSEVSDSNQ